MKIVFMGTPDFAVPALTALHGAGYELIGAVTQPDKAKGRSKEPVPSPVKAEALRLGIPVYQPARARNPEFIALMRELAPDMIVVSAFGQILPADLLQIPPLGCINVHASLLPKYRGAAPIQHAVMDGEAVSGVTIMRMDEGLDTGDMISKVVVPLSPDETGGSLFDKLSAAGARLLIETLPRIIDGSAVYEPQPEQSPTPYASMIRKSMGELDFRRSAGELSRRIRGLSPWPGSFTRLNGKVFKIIKARAVEGREGAGCGELLAADQKGLLIACGSGALLATEVQLEGKKQMPAGDFLRGCPLQAGFVFPLPENEPAEKRPK